MKKNLLSSKTIWVAFLIFVGSILVQAGVVDLSLEETAGWIGIAIGAIQFILRLVTKSEITIE